MTERHGTYQCETSLREVPAKGELFQYSELLADINRTVEEGYGVVRQLCDALAPVLVDRSTPEKAREELREIKQGVLLNELDNTGVGVTRLVDQLRNVLRSVEL